MSRPCLCDRYNRNPFAPFTLDQCRLCWLYHHIVEYREHWDAAPQRVHPSGKPFVPKGCKNCHTPPPLAG